MKRRLSRLLAAAMACVLLAGCGSSEAPAAEPAGGNGLYAAVPKEDIRVGVVYAGDPETDPAGCGAHERGIAEMQQNLGLDEEQIIRVTGVDDQDPAAVRSALEDLVGQKCRIIFATAEGYAETTASLAAAYPEVIFYQHGEARSNGFNLTAYGGKIDQAWYLAGLAAGINTESGRIGYVAAGDSGAAAGEINAFALGVESAAPDAQVLVRETAAWNDPAGEGQAARALIEMGCDVIAQYSGTLNPVFAAQSAGVFAIGYNVDAASRAPSAVLTSVLWDWSVFYTEAVQAVIDGAWLGEDYLGGLQDGLAALAPLSALCAADTWNAVSEAEGRFLAGTLTVPGGQAGSAAGGDGPADPQDEQARYNRNVSLV